MRQASAPRRSGFFFRGAVKWTVPPVQHKAVGRRIGTQSSFKSWGFDGHVLAATSNRRLTLALDESLAEVTIVVKCSICYKLSLGFEKWPEDEPKRISDEDVWVGRHRIFDFRRL